MDNKSLKRLNDIVEAIALIKLFVENQSLQEFKHDIKTQKAILYQFIIIGEAVKNIDQDILNQYEYPWHVPKSFRNFIAHEYHNIRIDRIYNAIHDLDGLTMAIKQIINESKSIR
ncbi:MAG: HepT-like ribonuclease domain-containing protein [Saprospiraceae bacterium]